MGFHEWEDQGFVQKVFRYLAHLFSLETGEQAVMVVLDGLNALALQNEVRHEGLDLASEDIRISNWFKDYLGN